MHSSMLSHGASSCEVSAAAGFALDIHARIPSPPSELLRCDAEDAQRDARLIERFVLQSVARELMPRERVAVCLRRPVPGRSVVEIYHASRTRSAHYGALQVCGSVWLCACCAAKVSERRRVELHQGVEAWLGEGAEHRLVLATFTIQHRPCDALSAVLRRLKGAREYLLSGAPGMRLRSRYSIAGSIRTLEVTHGKSGWHPHMHVLMFLERDGVVEGLRDYLAERWPKCVASAGGYASRAGFDMQVSDQQVADYVAKWGRQPTWTTAHEMTKAVVKKGHQSGRTPTELLLAYAQGDCDAGRLWIQYGCTFKGERQLWWSHGLRERLGLVIEQSDEELAAAHEEDAQLLGLLRLDQWRVVVANDARAEILQAARSGDWSDVSAVLERLGANVA